MTIEKSNIENKKRADYLEKFTFLLFIAIILILAISIGYRNYDIGTDTISYISFYNKVLVGEDTRIREPFFMLLAKVTVFSSFKHEVFLSLVSFISLITYYFFINNVAKVLKFNLIYKKKIFIFIVFILTLSSFFYWNTQLNVIRNGLAMPFLFMSLYYFYFLNLKKFFLFYLLALLSHFSIILFLPFFFLFYIRNFGILGIYFVLSLFYITALNKTIFYLMASGFYQFDFLLYYLNNATNERGYESGIRLDFYIFTSVFYFLLYFMQRKNIEVDLIFKIYSVLIFPFLFLGFINYSDRLLLAAWNLIPIIMSIVLLYKIKLIKLYYMVSFFLLCCSIVGSLYYRELLI